MYHDLNDVIDLTEIPEFSEVTARYYAEAQTLSELFSDFSTLPLKPYDRLVNKLFKSCLYEVDLILKQSRLHRRVLSASSLSALERRFQALRPARPSKRDKRVKRVKTALPAPEQPPALLQSTEKADNSSS